MSQLQPVTLSWQYAAYMPTSRLAFVGITSDAVASYAKLISDRKNLPNHSVEFPQGVGFV